MKTVGEPSEIKNLSSASVRTVTVSFWMGINSSTVLQYFNRIIKTSELQSDTESSSGFCRFALCSGFVVLLLEIWH